MKRGVILLAILLLGLIPVLAITRAQAPEQKYFPQTGHEIADSFFETYYLAEHPLVVFGIPTTPMMLSQDGNKSVQYFSKTRFELAAGDTVVRTPLGSIYYQREQPEAEDSPFSSPCRLYEETGQKVCHQFLAFFDRNGGVEQFGLPLSPITRRGGRTAQYFEYAILEYRPENPEDSRVTVANLGETYFKDLDEPEKKKISETRPVVVLDLYVQAFIARDSAAHNYEPVLYVIIRDQTRAPVADATVKFTLLYPDGSEDGFVMEPTNRFGFSKMKFDANDSTPGMVEVIIQASRLELNKETRTSFRIWY